MPPPSLLLKRIVFAAILLAIAAYAGDYLWLRARITLPKLGAAFGSVHRYRLYAISEKGNKVEYQLDAQRPEEDVPCVHSLFPHLDYRPCWYLQRTSQQPIPMVIFPLPTKLFQNYRNADR